MQGLNWDEMFGQEKSPSLIEISDFIDNTIWNNLCSFIEESYNVAPKVEYSPCSAAKGWNVKYKKGGKSLCVLYPDKGKFTCLVVIGHKEQQEAEFLLPTMDSYIYELYQNTRFACGGRWLMIEVKNEKILENVKTLISLRLKKK